MASVVLTDSSQLTSDGFENFPDQIMYPYAEPYDLQKHVFSSYEFRSKVACENDVVLLQCNPNSRIAVYSASYGRTEYESIQCPQPQGVPEETCLVSYATETVMHVCHGKRRCTLSADAATFGNPCRPESRMYLKVVYTCGQYITGSLETYITGDSTYLETVHIWIQYNTGYTTTLETVHHWLHYIIGDSTSLVTLQHWRQYITGYTTTLETIHHWLHYITGYTTTLATQQHWRQYITGDNTLLVTLHHWLHNNTGYTTTLETIHHWRQYITGYTTSLDTVHHWLHYIIGDTTSLETIHHWLHYNTGDGL
uniref:SUEL-type lectin domain-containing protein n=1 Tax=Timema shepardi TaxID=629360 RepID=A0A7R9AYV3_TIMSH|nr:unnamed protein product [Timema shepardi]